SDTLPREYVPSNEGHIKGEMDQDGCIKLKGNKVPKGMVSLEDLFDNHDRYIKSNSSQKYHQSAKYKKVNIGSHDEPKM
ncbi:hypothetical protein KI387_010042, partial [Taxus chinensis]